VISWEVANRKESYKGQQSGSHRGSRILNGAFLRTFLGEEFEKRQGGKEIIEEVLRLLEITEKVASTRIKKKGAPAIHSGAAATANKKGKGALGVATRRERGTSQLGTVTFPANRSFLRRRDKRHDTGI